MGERGYTGVIPINSRWRIYTEPAIKIGSKEGLDIESKAKKLRSSKKDYLDMHADETLSREELVEY